MSQPARKVAGALASNQLIPSDITALVAFTGSTAVGLQLFDACNVTVDACNVTKSDSAPATQAAKVLEPAAVTRLR